MFLAWGWRWHGFGTILFAFAFIAWSMVSVYGFMATRIAASEGHKNSIKVQERYLSWVQGQTVNFDLPKSERHAMKDEVKTTVDKLTSAAKVIPDAQAASLAGMFGTSVERIQRTLIVISSGIAQSIKFACMFYGLFAWPYRRSSATSSAGSSSGNSSGNSRFSGERTSSEQSPKDNIIKLPSAVAANFTANIELPQVRQSNFEVRQVRKTEVRPHVVQPNVGDARTIILWSRSRGHRAKQLILREAVVALNADSAFAREAQETLGFVPFYESGPTRSCGPLSMHHPTPFRCSTSTSIM
jgi:hypothetical protein